MLHCISSVNKMARTIQPQKGASLEEGVVQPKCCNVILNHLHRLRRGLIENFIWIEVPFITACINVTYQNTTIAMRPIKNHSLSNL